MTEDGARSWLKARYSKAVVEMLAAFVDLIEAEASNQNLVSRTSLEHIWSRHIVDSAQLIDLAVNDGLWIDIGTGAGFPGMVTAIVTKRQTVLVEPRRRRVEFLHSVVDRLALSNFVQVTHARAESVTAIGSVISARAVATVADLLTSARNCSNEATQWLLPKGRHAPEEVAQAKKTWHGTFHVEQSLTDPESMIVVASGISPR